MHRIILVVKTGRHAGVVSYKQKQIHQLTTTATTDNDTCQSNSIVECAVHGLATHVHVLRECLYTDPRLSAYTIRLHHIAMRASGRMLVYLFTMNICINTHVQLCEHLCNVGPLKHIIVLCRLYYTLVYY